MESGDSQRREVFDRPLALVLLILTESIVCVIDVVVGLGLFQWASYWWTQRSNTGQAALDAVIGVVFLIVAAATYTAARALWSRHPNAWKMAIYAACGMLGLVLLNVVLYGLTVASIIGIPVQLATLWGLNLNSVRAVFERPKSDFLQLG